MKQPNILFILADYLGWCDLCAEGSDFYESRNLDRICAMCLDICRGDALSFIPAEERSK